MAEKKSSASGDIGVTGLLQVAFIVLKLCNVINWSWWWVFAPSWGTLAFVVLIFAAVVVISVLRDKRKVRKKVKHD